jgi:hypothetical protein
VYDEGAGCVEDAYGLGADAAGTAWGVLGFVLRMALQRMDMELEIQDIPEITTTFPLREERVLSLSVIAAILGGDEKAVNRYNLTFFTLGSKDLRSAHHVSA